MSLSIMNDASHQYNLSGYHVLRRRPLLSAEEVVEEATRLIEKNSADVNALLRRAKAYMRVGDHRAAHSDLSVILTLPQESSHLARTVHVLFARGVCNAKLSFFNQAIEDLTAALKIDPSHFRSAYERAACLNIKGNFNEAILDYERALKCDMRCGDYFTSSRTVQSRFAKLRQQHHHSLFFYPGKYFSTDADETRRESCSEEGSQIGTTPKRNLLMSSTAGEVSKSNDLFVAFPFSSLDESKVVAAPMFSVFNFGTAELHHQRGLEYRKRGDLVGAIREYTFAIFFDPNNFRALFNRGFCHDKIGDYDAAISDYKAAMKLEPDYAYTYYNLGISYDHRGDSYEEAIAMFSRAIALDGSNADFYHNRGFSQRKLGNYREAVKDYTMSLSLDSNHFKAYYNRAFCFEKLGDITAAIADYGSAIAIQDANPNAFYNRGVALEKNGLFANAIADYTRAIQLDDENPFTFNASGAIYDRIGKTTAALQDLTRVIKLLPNNATFYQNRASGHQNVGRFYEALQDYDIFLMLYFQKNLTTAPTDDDDDDDDCGAGGGTANGCPTAQQADPVLIKVYHNRGLCCVCEGQYEAAIQDFLKIIAVDSNNVTALFNRGVCYEKLENCLLAVKDFSSVISLDLRNADAYFNRGNVLELMGEYAMALDDYAVAFKLDLE